MKNLVLLMVAFFSISTLSGCSKKNEQEAALDSMTNGVVTENVISLDASIPVIVDNAEAVPQTTGEMAEGVVIPKEKPTAKEIQQALKNAGFYTGKVDGTIGPKTKKAIEEFQVQNGLKADGKVGPKTWRALSSFLNQASEVLNPTAEVQTIGQ